VSPSSNPRTRRSPLSLDDAIALGLERNVRLKYDRANQRADRAMTLGVINALLPSLTFDAQSSAQELNLAAQGFKPALFAKFASSGLIPPGFKIATIVKVNTTQAQLSLDQVLFNATDIELYRGTKHETQVVDLNLLSDRGDLVLTTGMAYLQVLADQANLSNAQAQEHSAKTLFDQASAKQKAGVGIHLDTLRARCSTSSASRTRSPRRTRWIRTPSSSPASSAFPPASRCASRIPRPSASSLRWTSTPPRSPPTRTARTCSVCSSRSRSPAWS
jgi:outer membrane protein TolC